MNGKRFDRFVGAGVDVVGRPAQRIVLDRLRELLAVAGRAAVVGHQHHVAGLRQQVIVPAQRDRVAPHVRGAAVHEDEERVLLVRIEVLRQRDHVVDAHAVLVREPEVLERLPVERGRLLDVEVRQVAARLRRPDRCGRLPADRSRFPIGRPSPSTATSPRSRDRCTRRVPARPPGARRRPSTRRRRSSRGLSPQP